MSPGWSLEASPSQALRLHLEATDLCWIQYTLDHQLTQEAQLQRGESLDLQAKQTIQLLVGNAGGLRVQYNNQWLQNLGTPGRPARLSFPPTQSQPPAPAPAPPSP